MKRGTLNNERLAARNVIFRFDSFFEPWDWEHNGPAGPRTPMDYCINEVRRSYALVLIVGAILTDHTHKEYKVARNQRKHLFIFFKKGRQRKMAFTFRKTLQKRSSPSWREFQNASELESMLYLSLRNHVHIALSEFKAVPSTTIKYKGIKP